MKCARLDDVRDALRAAARQEQMHEYSDDQSAERGNQYHLPPREAAYLGKHILAGKAEANVLDEGEEFTKSDRPIGHDGTDHGGQNGKDELIVTGDPALAQG